MSAPNPLGPWLQRLAAAKSASEPAAKHGQKRKNADDALPWLNTDQARSLGAASASTKASPFVGNVVSVVPGGTGQNGSSLDLLTCKAVQELLQGRSDLPDVQTVGTVCSGSELSSVVLSGITEHLKSANATGTSFDLKYICEKNPSKRKFAGAIVKACGHRKFCMFADVLDMGKGSASCETHEKKCDVCRVHGLVAGTSCKDLSKANPKPTKHVYDKATTPGGTADTLWGLLAIVDKHPPIWSIQEQSDTLANANGQERDCPQDIDVYLAHWGARGFEIVATLVEACDYGSSWRRCRTWFFAVHAASRILFCQWTARQFIVPAGRATIVIRAHTFGEAIWCQVELGWCQVEAHW